MVSTRPPPEKRSRFAKFQPVIHHREGEIQRFQHFFEAREICPPPKTLTLHPAGKLFFSKRYPLPALQRNDCLFSRSVQTFTVSPF